MGDLNDIIILIPVILFALSVHEYSHGIVAYRLGDPTAYQAGRLTLNPLSHLDPVGTLMLFVAGIGWAKPVPVDPRYFQNPRRDMLWVALAGPASNMVLALLSGLIIRAMNANVELTLSLPFSSQLVAMVYRSLWINLALAVFNLLPIPPLDGSKILGGLLPPEYDHFLYNLERYGPGVLFGLVMFGMLTGVSILWLMIGPFVTFFAAVFAGV